VAAALCSLPPSKTVSTKVESVFEFKTFKFKDMSDSKGHLMGYYILIGLILSPITAGISIVIAIIGCILTASLDD
jgi:hypothetical protein